MARKVKQDSTIGETGRTLIRILIASYFVAAAVGIIPGYDANALTAYMMPEPWASYVGVSIGITLAFLILTGLALRTAALLMAMLLFWSSYTAMATVGFQAQLGQFWRDLALIGALLLTYSDENAAGGRALFRRLPKVRRLRAVEPKHDIRPSRVRSEPSPAHRERGPLIQLATVDGEREADLAKRASG